MFRIRPKPCQAAYPHLGEHGSFPLALFSVNRWLRQNGHIVFVFEAVGVNFSGTKMYTASNTLTNP